MDEENFQHPLYTESPRSVLLSKVLTLVKHT